MLKNIMSNWLMPAMALSIVLVAASLLAPGWASMIEAILLFLILAAAILPVLRRQTKLHREHRISRTKMARNILYEFMGILLAMILAALLARSIMGIAAAQTSNALAKFMLGIVTGLLAGMCVGFLIKQSWGRLVKP